MTDEHLLGLFKAKRFEVGTAELAKVLGISDVTVRSVGSGNYPGDPGKVLKKFAQHYRCSRLPLCGAHPKQGRLQKQGKQPKTLWWGE